jgi:hypothetical protein
VLTVSTGELSAKATSWMRAAQLTTASTRLEIKLDRAGTPVRPNSRNQPAASIMIATSSTKILLPQLCPQCSYLSLSESSKN